MPLYALREIGESVVIGDDEIVVTVAAIVGRSVRLQFRHPIEMKPTRAVSPKEQSVPPTDPTIVRLIQLVEADGRTQAEIATAAGMSPAQFSQIMTGHRAAPSVATVRRILDALGKYWADLDVKPTRRPSRRKGES